MTFRIASDMGSSPHLRNQSGARRGVSLAHKARFTTCELDSAVERGLSFIGQFAERPECLLELGEDLLWCFYTISDTSKNRRIKHMALEMGQILAHQWKQHHLEPPPEPDEIRAFISGVDAAERLLGEHDQALKNRLRTIVGSFGAKDFLAFDPKREPPPKNIPELCSNCESANSRGADACIECSQPLTFSSHYRVWCEALVATYTGEIYGVPLGARYSDVLQWISCMRPYPRQEALSPNANDLDHAFYAFYAITHLVYTLNDYGRFRLAPALFTPELDYLEARLIAARTQQDAEMLGESLDTLYCFGRDQKHRDIQAGIALLLSCQNDDGSWGDCEDEDTYNRFHSTWTAVDGLREYSYRGERDLSGIFS